MFNPGCVDEPCCEEGPTPCTELAGNNLMLTCPSGTHTLVYSFTGSIHAWNCCLEVTKPYTRDNILAGCPSVASGLARINYKLGNCPPYGTSEDSTRGLIFSINTPLNPCAASPDGYVYIRTSVCSGNSLTSPNYTFLFLDDEYEPEYPFGADGVAIDFTAGPFSMSFTLPSIDSNGYPVPYPGDYVITLP